MLSCMVEYSSEQDPNRNVFGREARGIRTLRGVFYADCFGFIVSPSLIPIKSIDVPMTRLLPPTRRNQQGVVSEQGPSNRAQAYR